LTAVVLLAVLPMTSTSGAGNVPTCFGRPATIIASREDPTFGTGGPDVIVGNARSNDILAGKGDDLVCGLRRGDHIAGGPGNDRLSGGPGGDSIEGEGDPGGRDGKDEIFGGPGHDTCHQYILAMTGHGGGSGSKRTRSCELII
jgi:Ca2+-binding RTX toxin-like protein